MPRLIEVIVSPQGETTVQTKGYVGSDCLQASRFLEQALGVVANDQKTAEYYERETTSAATHAIALSASFGGPRTARSAMRGPPSCPPSIPTIPKPLPKGTDCS